AREISGSLGKTAGPFARSRASFERAFATFPGCWTGDGWRQNLRRSLPGGGALAGDHESTCGKGERGSQALGRGPAAGPERDAAVSRCDGAAVLPCPDGHFEWAPVQVTAPAVSYS